MLDMINRRLKIISDLEAELNKVRGLYEESLDGDTKYREIQEKEEEFKKAKNEAKVEKEKVLENPTLKTMQDKLREIREEIKEHKEALGQELAEYYRDSGSMEITDADGNVKRIKFSAKLINS